MRASHVKESNHLRERAAEMRASSKELKDNNTTALIMRLADLYDRVADRAETRGDHVVRLDGESVEALSESLQLFIGLVTAAARPSCRCSRRGPIGIPDHSIVVGSLGSAGCLAVILAFASIIGRNSN